ncbi:MAG: hypothetical protein IJY43_06765 [Clostridia bacterium]|nr:hypothetical protein [Clostridia bacterium]
MKTIVVKLLASFLALGMLLSLASCSFLDKAPKTEEETVDARSSIEKLYENTGLSKKIKVGMSREKVKSIIGDSYPLVSETPVIDEKGKTCGYFLSYQIGVLFDQEAALCLSFNKMDLLEKTMSLNFSSLSETEVRQFSDSLAEDAIAAKNLNGSGTYVTISYNSSLDKEDKKYQSIEKSQDEWPSEKIDNIHTISYGVIRDVDDTPYFESMFINYYATTNDYNVYFYL